MPSPLCPQLHEKLSSLSNIQRDLEDLKVRLLTEGVSSVPEIKEEFTIKQREITKTQEELEKLLKEITPEKPKDTVESIKKMLESIGNPKLSLDESFEGGVISLEIPDTVQEKLQTLDKAKEAYTQADTTSVYINPNFNDSHFTPVTSSHLDILVFNHGGTTQEERNKLVHDMDTLGFRPLTLSELFALGIIKPEVNKRNEILNTYKEYSLVGDLHAPYLSWDGVRRRLGADGVSSGWNGHRRFVFVRK